MGNSVKHILIVLILIISSTHVYGGVDEIVGTWKGTDPKDGVLIFRNDYSLEIKRDINETDSVGTGKVKFKWETITEVNPNQLYFIISLDEKTQRIPFGIYKINNNKLIIRQSKEFHKSLGGIDMGVSRYELHKNFKGILKVFKKIK